LEWIALESQEIFELADEDGDCMLVR
jgi:hypothetical protein